MLPICLALGLGAPVAPTVAPEPTPFVQEGVLDTLTGDASWHTLRWKWFQVEKQFGDPDGWRVGGSIPLTEQLYGYGSWAFLQEEGASGDDLIFGVGYHSPLEALNEVTEETEWFSRLGFRNTDAGIQEFGFELAGGLRSIITERIETELTVGYRETFEAEFFGTVRAEYELTRNIATNLAIDIGEEENLLWGLRFYPDMNF